MNLAIFIKYFSKKKKKKVVVQYILMNIYFQKGLMNLITRAAQPCLKLLDLENTEEYVLVKQNLKLQLHVS